MNDDPILVDSDKYFNDEDFAKRFEGFGQKVIPVSTNWGFVDEDSLPDKSLEDAKEDLETAQYTIRKRFSLGE